MHQPIITIRDLRKKFGDFIAVDGLSFDIYRNEVFGFLGPNGAGKTTTISMICGLMPPSSGSISFHLNGTNRQREIKSQLGYCPQENIFWPKLTCREQMIFMAEMYGLKGKPVSKRSDELLGLMGLKEKSNVLAGKLSGGMKRRLSICLALVHDPDILILDEPEAGLDPQSRLLVRDFITSLARTKTILLTTHNMDEAEKLSDRVAIIDHGKLLMLDTPQNLKKTIGEGDILELQIGRVLPNEQSMKKQTGPVDSEQESRLPGELIDLLSKITDKVYLHDDTLILKSLHILDAVPAVSEAIKNLGWKINEMKLRENSLEDVFIHLTGRKLRS